MIKHNYINQSWLGVQGRGIWVKHPVQWGFRFPPEWKHIYEVRGRKDQAPSCLSPRPLSSTSPSHFRCQFWGLLSYTTHVQPPQQSGLPGPLPFSEGPLTVSPLSQHLLSSLSTFALHLHLTTRPPLYFSLLLQNTTVMRGPWDAGGFGILFNSCCLPATKYHSFPPSSPTSHTFCKFLPFKLKTFCLCPWQMTLRSSQERPLFWILSSTLLSSYFTVTFSVGNLGNRGTLWKSE